MNSLPFSPGEKLTFQVRWSFIPAGETVLQVLPIETIGGVSALHFVMTARTYPLIDLFYKVRDRIDSYTDTQMTHTLLYTKQNRGKTTRDVVVTFNWKKQEAQYSNNGERAAPISLVPGSFDPLSIFYAFRLHHLTENLVIQAPVADGKKCVMGRAMVIKRETITVVSGTYDTFLLEPDLKHIGGVFQKSPHAKLKIWVTADSKRIPVKIKSKVVVGSFVAELIRPRQSKEEGSRSRVQRFSGSRFTKNPPAIPARSTAGGHRRGLNSCFVSSERSPTEVQSEPSLVLDQSEFQDMYDRARRTSATGRGFIPPYIWRAGLQAKSTKER